MNSSICKETVALDPSIRHGVLDNGLTYYIKPTDNGSSQMDIRLIVKAGSSILDQDQYELQHVMEHVAFKSGRNMTMAKAHNLGFKMGEINGNTSHYFVQYHLKSTYTEQKRDIAFDLFHDIIWGLELKSEYIDSERSVIINELAERGRFGAGSILTSLESTMTGRTPKAPKDIVKYIKTFPHGPLKRYYRDWYRPDLMAIVVVGDIEDVDDMENEIKTRFSKDKPVENPRTPNVDYSKYRSQAPQFISQEHPYLLKGSKKRTAYLRLYLKQKEKLEESGMEALRNEQQRQVLIDMLTARFMEQQEAYNTSFNILPKFMYPSSLGVQLNIKIDGGSEKEVIFGALRTIRQLETDGFTESEFKTAKENYLLALLKIDTSKVPYWKDNIIDHFVFGEVLPPNKNGLLKEIISDLTLDEFNRFAQQYIQTDTDNIDIITLAPPGHRMLSYSERTIRGWIANAINMPVVPYRNPSIPDELMDATTVSGLKKANIKKKSTPLPGTSEYLLDNGVRLVLHSISVPNPKQEHSLRFHGFTNRGISCYSQADYFSALNAADIVRNSGVGGLDKFELERYLSHNGFMGRVSPYLAHDEAGIKGAVSLEDLETAMQLIYLYFTAPNKNKLAFEDWKLKSGSSIVLKNINEKDFNTAVSAVLRDETFLPKGTKALKGVTKTDLDRALAIYKEIYGNASDFTFGLTGDFPEDQVLHLCQKYLGNLPVGKDRNNCGIQKTSKKHDLPKPHAVAIPATEFMQEVKVRLGYISGIDTSGLDWKREIKLKLLQSLMNFSIMQEMRFESTKEGGSYYAVVACNQNSGLFTEVFVTFSSSPEDTDRLIRQAKGFMTSFKNSIVDVELLERYKKMEVLNLEKKKNNRMYISDKIHAYYKLGRPWHSIEEEQEYIKSISPLDIKHLAQKLLKVKPFEFRMVSSRELQ
ncbi:insulinase family protein [Tamlana crocina]